MTQWLAQLMILWTAAAVVSVHASDWNKLHHMHRHDGSIMSRHARKMHRFQDPSRAALRSLRHAMHQSSPSSLYALSGTTKTSPPRTSNIYTCSAEKGVPVSSRTGKSVAGSWKIRPYSMDRSMGQARGQSSLSGKLIFVNVACYILQTMNPAVTKFGAKVSDAILSGRQPHRLLTPIFLHGGIAHLMTNSYSLQNIGPEVERLFGGGRFMATYMISGITGNLLSAIKSPNPAVGASGAIFGIAGAYFVFLQRNRDYLGRQGDQQLNSVAQMIIMNVVVGSISPMIDNWGHIGGALGGAAMSYVFGPRLYVAQLPSGQRIMVDKPIARLPRSIEAIPERIGNGMNRLTKSLQIPSFGLKFGSGKRQQYRQRRRSSLPIRSIRPSAY